MRFEQLDTIHFKKNKLINIGEPQGLPQSLGR